MNKKYMNISKDMYLPAWLLVFGLFSLAVAVVLFAFAMSESMYLLIGFVIFFTLGFAAILCQQNQWAKMNDDGTFTYSTMFGNKKEYRFSDIIELKQNSDSRTLILENGQVHIESIAVMSERFVDAINGVIESRSSLN